VIEAQQAILDINIISYPHTKKEAQNKLIKDLKKKCQIGKSQAIDLEDFVRMINGK
jgi:hypothetical protein